MPGTLDVVDVEGIDISDIQFGKVSGEPVWPHIAIERSVELAKSGNITAIATAPINKEAIKVPNIDFIGHTEMLAGLTETNDPLTMFQVGDLRVFFFQDMFLEKACDLPQRKYNRLCYEAL